MSRLLLRVIRVGLIAALAVPSCAARTVFEQDILETSAGPLTLTFIGHGTLMFAMADLTVHVDPVGREADYDSLSKADLILVTHNHGDHLDPGAIALLRKETTAVVVAPSCADRVEGAIVMQNGDVRTEKGLRIEAVPAYNIVNLRGDTPYHPKGDGNGYIITFGESRIYVAGDTENTPEMKALQDIDVAFLPMNLPYTMTPEMVADAARVFRPRIVYPYHFGNTDTALLVEMLRDVEGVEVRIRDF